MASMPRSRGLQGALARGLRVLFADFDTGPLQYRCGLLRVRAAQQATQRRPSRFSSSSVHLAQGTNRGLQFLVSGFAQRFPHALQQGFHKARLSPPRSGALVPFHSMRILPRRPSNSITHSDRPGSAWPSAPQTPGVPKAVLEAASPSGPWPPETGHCTRRFRQPLQLAILQMQSPSRWGRPRGQLDCCRPKKFGIGKRPVCTLRQRSKRREDLLHVVGNIGRLPGHSRVLIAALPPLKSSAAEDRRYQLRPSRVMQACRKDTVRSPRFTLSRARTSVSAPQGS